ncbi:MAG: hypothetical protein IT385_12975 [Deltaproteobacteria bacterium]|nr:hypothetical protein [Deltaproteobacteria bacterium]
MKATLLVALGALATTFALGLGLGALAWVVSVIGLWALATGLALGVVMTTLVVATSRPDRRPGRGVIVGVALAASVVGWAAARVVEDDHIVDRYQIEVARARAASTGIAPGELAAALEAPGAIDFWARGAEAELDAQVVADVGFGGIAGRWWWQAGNGVRLAGSWSAARGLPVGRAGAVVWALCELALATWIATRVVARGTREPPPTPSSGAGA